MRSVAKSGETRNCSINGDGETNPDGDVVAQVFAWSCVAYSLTVVVVAEVGKTAAQKAVPSLANVGEAATPAHRGNDGAVAACAPAGSRAKLANATALAERIASDAEIAMDQYSTVSSKYPASVPMPTSATGSYTLALTVLTSEPPCCRPSPGHTLLVNFATKFSFIDR